MIVESLAIYIFDSMYGCQMVAENRPRDLTILWRKKEGPDVWIELAAEYAAEDKDANKPVHANTAAVQSSVVNSYQSQLPKSKC